jgi:hypothetical protein
VNLGGIYEVRISSMIEVHGEDATGSNVGADQWEAWTEYRTSDHVVFISDWQKMSDEPDLAGTFTGGWSSWRRFQVTDITTQMIQFRLVLQSNDVNVRAHVTDGSILIDAVDRMWSKKDIPIGARVTRINFDIPFMFDDVSVAVSVDGSTKHLIPNVTNKSRTGVDIALLDAQSNALSAGQVDVIVRGQGKERTKTI